LRAPICFTPKTAGDWDITVQSAYGGTSTSVSALRTSISTTSNAEDTTLDRWASAPIVSASNLFSIFNVGFMVGPSRLSLATPTTVYYVGRANFSGGTCTGYGFIRARRVR
jgi:hypothetical protein